MKPVIYATPKKFMVAWIISFVSMLGLTGASMQYANHAVQQQNIQERESDRQWCDLIVFYTDYYREQPPRTDTQKRQQALMERRRTELGC